MNKLGHNENDKMKQILAECRTCKRSWQFQVKHAQHEKMQEKVDKKKKKIFLKDKIFEYQYLFKVKYYKMLNLEHKQF